MAEYNSKLITRFLSNECTDEEKEHIHQLMQSDPQFRQEIERLQHMWSVKRKPITEIDKRFAWEQVKSKANICYNVRPEKIKTRPRQKLNWAFLPAFPATKRLFAYALVILLIVFGSYITFRYLPILEQSQDILTFKSIKVKNGKRYTLHLRDGSKVILDAGSELKYPDSFSDTRQVHLQGEAFFEVAHDPERPFYVLAKHAKVKVLGTRFNVRAWEENKSVDVVVQRGKVALTHYTVETDTVILTTGKYSSVPETGFPIKPVEVNVRDYLGWMHNEMNFKSASLKEIIAHFERWYDYQFIVDDKGILDKKLTVHLKKSNVNDVIELISVLTNTCVERNGKEIKLIKK